MYDMVAYPDFAGVTERQAAGDRKWSSCVPEVKQQLQSSDIDGVPPFKDTTRISRDQYVPQQNGRNENDRASRKLSSAKIPKNKRLSGTNIKAN